VDWVIVVLENLGDHAVYVLEEGDRQVGLGTDQELDPHQVPHCDETPDESED
jgi:hypothetical protein